jgi:fibronectin-binding autotransporter adhesin
MNRTIRLGTACLAVFIVAAFARLSSQTAAAAQITWNGNGANALWTTGSNWVGGTAPVSGVDSLAFDGSTRLANTNDLSNFSTTNIIFASTAGAFTLSGSSVTQNGILDNLSLTQTQTLNFNVQTATGITFRTANGATASGDIVMNGVIGGAGGIEKQVTSNNIASLVLSGLNTYTGQTVLQAGNIKFNTINNVGGGASSLGAPTTVANGTIRFGNAANPVQLIYTGAGSTTDRNVTLGGSAGSYTIDQNGTGNLAFTGTFTSSPTVTTQRVLQLTGTTAGTGEISGPIQNGLLSGTTVTTVVRKQGTGTWSLTGSNSYSGATQVQAGVLNIRSASALGNTTGATTVTAGAALQLQNDITVTGEALTLNGSGVSSDGALRNVSGNNTYAGTITLGSDSRINSDSGLLTLNTGTITGSGFNLLVGGAGNTTISSIVGTGAGGLTKDGAGTLALQAANTYAGTASINGGTLALQHASALGGGGNATFGGGTLQYSASNTVDYSSKIVSSGSAIRIDTNGQNVIFASGLAASNTGGLTKSGDGTLTLTGSSSYAGATAVDGGRLLVNGQLGNTAVTVNASGLLGGSGTILGGVTVASSGTLSPGNSPGVLTVGSLSLSDGSHTLMEITGTSASLYDQVVGVGSASLTYGGNLDLVMSGSYANGTTFNLFSNFSTKTLDFAAVGLNATGEYHGLMFTGTAGVWTSTWTDNHQRLVFSTATGNLVVVPEPSTVAMALAGLACGGWRMMRRRRLRQATSLAA